MLFWLILTTIVAITLAVVLMPLMKTQANGGLRAEFDAEVYSDQLSEIEADLERRLISEADAEAARTEISRRLLTVSDSNGADISAQDGRTTSLGSSKQLIVAGTGALICIPILSLALYTAYGSPQLSGQPHAARVKVQPQQQQIAGLIARVEEQLRNNPEDGVGWDVVAPVYMKFNRYQDAAAAYKHAIRLLGENAKRLMGAGEAETFANSGVINETSRQAFEKVLKIEPSMHKARYWLAVAKEQDGRFDDAVKAWQDLLSKGMTTALWRRQVEYCLQAARTRVGGSSGANGQTRAQARDMTCSEGGTPARTARKGPTAEQIAAVNQMAPGERLDMINQMVAGLAERLKEDGSDLEGWVKLVRAYTVLGRRDEARKAFANAETNFEGNAEALGTLENLEKQLKLGL